MTPRPYQCTGALFLAETPRGVLGDEPGLGKTAQLILAAKLVGALTILVICPAVAVRNWQREFQMWWPAAKPVIVSYDIATRMVSKGYKRTQWDVLILDEAHYLKNRDSQRTKAIYRPNAPEKGIAGMAHHVWAASGTLAPNDLTEYWTHLRVLRPDLIPSAEVGKAMTWTEFLMHYTTWSAGPYSIRIHSIKRRDELTTILGKLGLRRTVEDVLPDLPALCWGTVSVPRDAAAAGLREMEDAPEVQAIRERIDAGGDFDARDTVHLATLRRVVGEAKAAAIGGMVAGELTENHYRKIVIWAWHARVIDKLMRTLVAFYPVYIDGGVSLNQRQKNIDLFQRDPLCRVFVGQIVAAGTAITLTAANQVLFAESSWVPAEDLQAAKRCHRIGQTRPVFARYAALEDSIDEVVAAAQARKLSQHIDIGEPRI